jgi:hypothetical protein
MTVTLLYFTRSAVNLPILSKPSQVTFNLLSVIYGLVFKDQIKWEH